LRRPKSCCCLS